MAHGADREIEIHLQPSRYKVVLRCDTSDILCLEKVFSNMEYETPFPLDARVIVDAGANIGMATLFFAQKYPKARIIAIEPEHSNFQLLQRNCAGLANVVVLEAALWCDNRRLLIQDERAEKWMFSVAESDKQTSPGSQQVKAVTIPDLLKDFGLKHIYLLKLDIEGAEYELFRNGTEAWLGAVRQIVIELHDRFRPGCAQGFYAALAHRAFAQEIRGENIFIKLAD